jgi:hypothetical protein
MCRLMSAFWAMGCLDWPVNVTPLMYLPALLACSAAATIVEALPINHVSSWVWAWLCSPQHTFACCGHLLTDPTCC